jgi:OFA family oxalate/formate antiporter-like MFS transporter
LKGFLFRGWCLSMASSDNEAGKVSSSRWNYVAAAVVINLCLGAVYAFSILVPPLEAEFGWTRIETSPAFTIALVAFALTMIPAGRIQDERGPRIVATVGGALIGLGMVLSSYTDSLMWLYVSYGMLLGLGTGFAYGAPIATCTKWFPDKKGLVTGLVVFGFGGGAIIFAPLWAYLIEAYDWRFNFLFTGLLFTVLIIISAQILKNPSKDYKPAGWTAPVKSLKPKADYGSAEMIKTVSFILIWVSYWFGTTAGLMTISQAKLIAMELAGMDSIQASLAVSILGAFNALGRLLWGFLGDRIGREKALTASFLACAAALFVLSTMFEPVMFVAGMSLLGLCFGGFLALYPALTSDYYGSKNLGINYGLVFTAYGAGSVLGPIMASYFRTYDGTYLPAFYISIVLALLGVVLTVFLKKKAP